MSEFELKPAEYRAAAQLRAGLRHFLHASAEVLQAYGLTPERYELLLAIKAAADGSERATVGELAVALELAHSSATQLARRAEDAGLVRREVAMRDARVRYLRLTENGERQLAAAVAGLRHERETLATVAASLAGKPDRSATRGARRATRAGRVQARARQRPAP